MMNQEQTMSNKEALERFCKNLVADAKAGKLDPVIGRDDEIRRTTLSLSVSQVRVRRLLPRDSHSVSFAVMYLKI